MPLITCPDCNNQVSDTARACLHCGRPINPKGVPVPHYAKPKNFDKSTALRLCGVLAFLILLVVFLNTLMENNRGSRRSFRTKDFD